MVWVIGVTKTMGGLMRVNTTTIVAKMLLFCTPFVNAGNVKSQNHWWKQQSCKKNNDYTVHLRVFVEGKLRKYHLLSIGLIVDFLFFSKKRVR